MDAKDDPLGGRIGLRERVVAALAGRQDRARAVGSAAQRAEHVARWAVDARLVTPSARGRLLHAVDGVERAARRDEEPHARAADPRVARRARSTGSPNAASIAAPFRSTPSASSHSSASWPPPRRAATSITFGPSAESRTCVYDGPSWMPSAPAAASAAPAAASASRSAGPACASATPNAGAAATSRSVTVSAWKRPPTEKPLTVSSGPSTSSSRRQAPVRDSAAARSIASSSSSALVHDREPALALPVGRLDDERQRRRLARLPEPPARLRHARLVEPLALPELDGRERGRLGRDRVRQREPLGHPRGDGHRQVEMPGATARALN